MSLDQKVVLVTGAGSGIGESVAHKLAKSGAAVVVADVDDVGGARVRDAILQNGGKAIFVRADVSMEEDATNLVAEAVNQLGRLDGAVNNAGIGQRGHVRMHELEPSEWDRVCGINLRGVFLGMRAQIAHFLQAGGGSIVNTASVAGLKAIPYETAYVASKHGLIGLTRQAALEYVKDSIRVNAVAPGLIATPLVLASSAEKQAQFNAMQPGGRAGTPDEVANGIVWLLSDEASFVTGEVLTIDAALMQK